MQQECKRPQRVTDFVFLYKLFANIHMNATSFKIQFSLCVSACFAGPVLGLRHSQLMDVFTQYAYNDSFFDNGTWSYNETDKDQNHPYNYYAMLLTLLIFVIVFGNVLVCMAVSREKALQTTTNYLIVSLAVADLLVATLVMPWVVYLEVE